MPFEQFCLLTPAELQGVFDAYARDARRREQAEWERLRIHAYLCVLPQVSGSKKLTPEQLLPLPWDREQQAPTPAPKITTEQSRQRADELLRRFEKNTSSTCPKP